MAHSRKRTLKFFTLSCNDCGGPLINYDEDGVEYVLAFRSPELAELEATEMAEEDGGVKPGIIEVELKVVTGAKSSTENLDV